MSNGVWNGVCPECGSVNAFQGFSSWECPNYTCPNFSDKQRELVENEIRAQQRAVMGEALEQDEPAQQESLEFDLADTEPPGPPDPPVDQDPYIYGFGAWGAPGPAPASPQVDEAEAENEEEDDTYLYPLPDDMAFD